MYRQTCFPKAIRGVRLYVTGKNLFTFTKLNYDPERGGRKLPHDQTLRIWPERQSITQKLRINHEIISYKNGVIDTDALLTLFSCNDVLEEYNPSGLTAETVYTTPEGFETLVNAAYSYQRWWYGKEEGYNIAETGTDIWTSAAGETDRGLTQYLNLQGSNTYLSTEWREFYAAVNLCNGGINRIDKAGLSAALRPIREGELRFLRAFYYWHIVETWGGVHFTHGGNEWHCFHG